MGLFKDFKDDFSQAVNELVPGGEVEDLNQEEPVNTMAQEVDTNSELSKLDGLLTNAAPAAPVSAPQPQPVVNAQAADETSVITSGTNIVGDLASDGNFEIRGTINGSINCLGKIVVTGTINGNSQSAEFFADSSKVTGEISCSGTVKIGAGSVIIGNISATSAVIAGAVKGDIDVQGPVVVDTSAVVMGNIKSRSVQINNGAVIEGFCSQTYADVDMKNLFNI